MDDVGEVLVLPSKVFEQSYGVEGASGLQSFSLPPAPQLGPLPSSYCSCYCSFQLLLRSQQEQPGGWMFSPPPGSSTDSCGRHSPDYGLFPTVSHPYSFPSIQPGSAKWLPSVRAVKVFYTPLSRRGAQKRPIQGCMRMWKGTEAQAGTVLLCEQRIKPCFLFPHAAHPDV